MNSILFIVLVIVNLSYSKSLLTNFALEDVEYPVNYTSFRQIINPFLDTNLDVYAPNAPGSFPVLYFITGVGGI